jgi:hypothetical protein
VLRTNTRLTALQVVLRYRNLLAVEEGFLAAKTPIAAYYPETNNPMPLSYYDQRSKTPSAKSIPVLVRPMRDAGVRPGAAGASSGDGSQSAR